MNDQPLTPIDANKQQLSLYDAARFALSEARRIDEVKDIVDRAAALQEYARRAKDTQMLEDATELRFYAEQKAGELLAAMPKAIGARGSGSNQHQVRSPVATAPETQTLVKLKITKTQSSRWQKLAALPPEKFEIRKQHAKARVAGMTTSAPSAQGRGARQ